MAAAANHRLNQELCDETFLLSNMSPQVKNYDDAHLLIKDSDACLVRKMPSFSLKTRLKDSNYKREIDSVIYSFPFAGRCWF